ncbi:Imm1 family immunity protein [Actinokineospora sp. G85]|uniref:Imm1 family immunity protein n=1 Tax=Actinokineospora sp. G85 TaxID=3406626 RepID=UPI003C78F947
MEFAYFGTAHEFPADSEVALDVVRAALGAVGHRGQAAGLCGVAGKAVARGSGQRPFMVVETRWTRSRTSGR